jgi:predicted O-methyltransferase YrrM
VKAVKAIRKGMATDLLTTYRQLEALQNLYAMVPVDGPMPPTRVWACSPDLLLLLVNLIEVEKPSLIVECGSGTSTLWFALVLRRLGLDGQVVALEHQDVYVEKTRSMIERHGLGDLAEVRHVPLEPIQLGTETFQWYERSGWVDLTDIDLLLVDGPPAATGRHARFPALPLLVKHLHPNGVTVLDDLVRTDEQEIVTRWLRDFPEYSAEYVKLEKNAAILRR